MSVNNFTHVCGLCGETWIGAHICSKRATNVPFRVARLPRALDAASYRAGLEAAARMVEDFRRYRVHPKDALVDKSFDDDEVRCPHCDKKHDLKKSRYWCRDVYTGLTDLAAAIAALPTPSTLPQDDDNDEEDEDVDCLGCGGQC